mgnify:CR=1 FL=1
MKNIGIVSNEPQVESILMIGLSVQMMNDVLANFLS